MPRVLIQAGHYPNGGGAPGEAAWTHDLAQRIGRRLEPAGVQVTLIGDFYGQPAPTACAQDYDLFLALHYDAAIYAARGETNSGCFADRGAGDPVGAASDRFIAIWESIYPPATGIPLANQRRNPNTSRYYALAATTPRTPGVLIEHGCGALVSTGGFPPGDDATILHERIDLVADLDAQAVGQFLSRVEPAPPAASSPLHLLSDADRVILDVVHGLHASADSIAGWINQIGALEAANTALSAQLLAALTTTERKVAAVTVTYDDGTSQELQA